MDADDAGPDAEVGQDVGATAGLGGDPRTQVRSELSARS
jgi:hypothetical protein